MPQETPRSTRRSSPPTSTPATSTRPCSLAGAEAGSPVQFAPKYRPATGTTIKVTLALRGEGQAGHGAGPEVGQERRRPARSWTRDWVFAGSQLSTTRSTRGKPDLPGQRRRRDLRRQLRDAPARPADQKLQGRRRLALRRLHRAHPAAGHARSSSSSNRSRRRRSTPKPFSTSSLTQLPSRSLLLFLSSFVLSVLRRETGRQADRLRPRLTRPASSQAYSLLSVRAAEVHSLMRLQRSFDRPAPDSARPVALPTLAISYVATQTIAQVVYRHSVRSRRPSASLRSSPQT